MDVLAPLSEFQFLEGRDFVIQSKLCEGQINKRTGPVTVSGSDRPREGDRQLEPGTRDDHDRHHREKEAVAEDTEERCHKIGYI